MGERRLRVRKSGNETRHGGHRRTTDKCNNTAGRRETGRMAKRTQTNTGRRETDDRRRENGVRTNRTNREMKRIIGGILGEQGKDRMYEERGAGRRNERTAGQDGKENEDKTEGQAEDKGGPAGRDRTKTEDKPGGREGKVTKDRPAEKGKDTRPDQGTRGTNGRYSTPSHARTGGGPR